MDPVVTGQLGPGHPLARHVSDFLTDLSNANASAHTLRAYRGDLLQAEEEKLTLASQRLEAKVGAFRTRKETIKAAYTAAGAQTRVGEAVSGISEEMGDIGLAMRRAQDKTEQMQARAGALDELLASGALQDATVPGGRNDVQAQLDALTAGHDVDGELARMKARLPASAAPPAVEGPGTASAGTAGITARAVGHLVSARIPGESRRRSCLMPRHGRKLARSGLSPWWPRP